MPRVPRVPRVRQVHRVPRGTTKIIPGEALRVLPEVHHQAENRNWTSSLIKNCACHLTVGRGPHHQSCAQHLMGPYHTAVSLLCMRVYCIGHSVLEQLPVAHPTPSKFGPPCAITRDTNISVSAESPIRTGRKISPRVAGTSSRRPLFATSLALLFSPHVLSTWAAVVVPHGCAGQRNGLCKVDLKKNIHTIYSRFVPRRVKLFLERSTGAAANLNTPSLAFDAANACSYPSIGRFPQGQCLGTISTEALRALLPPGDHSGSRCAGKQGWSVT